MFKFLRNKYTEEEMLIKTQEAFETGVKWGAQYGDSLSGHLDQKTGMRKAPREPQIGDEECDTCGFQAKTPRGLSIHKARIHKNK